MSKQGVNKSRRRFLIAATAAVGAVGAVGVISPFLQSWKPSAKAKAAGSPVKVDIGKLELGQQVIVKWRGKPVYIVARTKEMLKNITANQKRVRDPYSTADQQPVYAKNEYRSIKAEILILLGVCTHLGCAPTFVPEVKPMEFDENWIGGYHCPCHGSKFDLAGRVFFGVPAPINLEVPIHEYLSESVVIIGQDEENLA